MMVKKESHWIKSIPTTGEFDNLLERDALTQFLSRTCDYSAQYSKNNVNVHSIISVYETVCPLRSRGIDH
jgi:hypothetical protein